MISFEQVQSLDVSQPPSTSTPAPYHYLDYDSDSYSDNDDFIGLLYPEEDSTSPATPPYGFSDEIQPVPQPPPPPQLEDFDVAKGDLAPIGDTGNSNHVSGYDDKWNLVEESPEKDKHTDYQEMEEVTQAPQATEAPTPTKSMSATMVLVIGIIVTAFGIMVLIFIIVLNVRTRAPYSINKCDGSGDPAHPHTHHNTAAAAPRYQFAPTGGPPATGPPQSDFGDLGRPDQETATTSLMEHPPCPPPSQAQQQQMRNAVMAAAAAAHAEAGGGFYNNNSCNGGGDRTRLFAGGGKGPGPPQQTSTQNSSKPVREWYV